MHTIFNQGENETYMEPFQLFITYLIVKIIKLSITHSATQSSVTLESVEKNIEREVWKQKFHISLSEQFCCWEEWS